MRLAALLIGSGVFLLDLLTKSWIQQNPRLRTRAFEVIEGFFRIEYIRNEGIAFGLLHDLQSEWKPLVLSAIALIAIVVVVIYIWSTPREERLILVGLGLLLGGILGNFADRLWDHSVVDFLTLHWQDQFAWPTFNLADSAITSGVVIILAKTFWNDFRDRKSQLGGYLALPLLLASPGLTAEEIVQKIESEYASLQSIEADFRQTVHNRGISQVEEGRVVLKKPGLMYWEYETPTEKYFVSNGEKLYFYVPAEGQVLVGDLEGRSRYSPLLFLLGQGNLERDYRVEREVSEEASKKASETVRLRLTPRVPQPEFKYVILETRPEDFLIRQLIVVEPIGQENEYYFYNLKKNVPVGQDRFEFEIPPGVEVIEE